MSYDGAVVARVAIGPKGEIVEYVRISRQSDTKKNQVSTLLTMPRLSIPIAFELPTKNNSSAMYKYTLPIINQAGLSKAKNSMK